MFHLVYFDIDFIGFYWLLFFSSLSKNSRLLRYTFALYVLHLLIRWWEQVKCTVTCECIGPKKFWNGLLLLKKRCGNRFTSIDFFSITLNFIPNNSSHIKVTTIKSESLFISMTNMNWTDETQMDMLDVLGQLVKIWLWSCLVFIFILHSISFYCIRMVIVIVCVMIP
jgi:hypothetical protein